MNNLEQRFSNFSRRPEFESGGPGGTPEPAAPASLRVMLIPPTWGATLEIYAPRDTWTGGSVLRAAAKNVHQPSNERGVAQSGNGTL